MCELLVSERARKSKCMQVALATMGMASITKSHMGVHMGFSMEVLNSEAKKYV